MNHFERFFFKSWVQCMNIPSLVLLGVCNDKNNPARLVLYAGLQSYLGKNFVWNLDVCIAGIDGCGFPDIKSGRQGGVE